MVLTKSLLHEREEQTLRVHTMSEELLCHHRHCYHRPLHHLKAGRTSSKCLIMTWEPTQLPPLPVEETCQCGRYLSFNFWGPAVIIFPCLCECLCTGHVRAKVGMGVGEECCKQFFPPPQHLATLLECHPCLIQVIWSPTFFLSSSCPTFCF